MKKVNIDKILKDSWENIRKYSKEKYLIYDVGYPEQGNECSHNYYRYYICEGESIEEAVNDFIRQSPFDSYYLGTDNKTYFVGDGRSWLQIVKLIGSDNKDKFQKLVWVEDKSNE